MFYSLPAHVKVDQAQQNSKLIGTTWRQIHIPNLKSICQKIAETSLEK